MSIAEKINIKELIVAERSMHKIPYTTKDGVFDDWSDRDRICWWTNGFFAGQLWLLNHAFPNNIYRKTAEEIEEKLDANLMSYMGMDHDSGFKWLLTSGANLAETGSEASKNRLLLAAGNLAGRLNLKAGLIRAWNDPGDGSTAGWAIIDCLMNLPLLYKASRITNDPRFAEIALCHAKNAINAFVRNNGSVKHIVSFDPRSGEIMGEPGGQGMGPGSSWTRGQAWALYGFGLSYRHTGEKVFLETAKKIADHLIEVIPDSHIIPVDYDQPADVGYEDSTAAAITACGFLELDMHLSGKKNIYKNTAVKLLETLADRVLDLCQDTDNLLTGCSAAYNDEKHNFPIIYGDYYFTEAILRLCDKLLFLW